MPYDILERVNKFYKKYGITIPETGTFIPGEHCPGETPFGKSQKCYETCFGTKGLTSCHNIPAPCKIKKKTQFEKNILHGIAAI
jgi:hypothetical protein